MNRIPFRSDFRVRFVFMDIDRLPVSMKDVDLDIWLYTKTNGQSFLASVRNGSALNCKVLDDGSVLVELRGHRLPPGRLRASINVHSYNHDFDGCPDTILHPNIPVELTESSVTHSADCDPECGLPIIVNVQFPMHRPSLTRHVTQSEMVQAIEAAINSSENATKEDVRQFIREALEEFICCDEDENVDDVKDIFKLPKRHGHQNGNDGGKHHGHHSGSESEGVEEESQEEPEQKRRRHPRIRFRE